jgi:molybdate transport system regulatory protein
MLSEYAGEVTYGAKVPWHEGNVTDYPLMRLRVILGPDAMFGPGKADLLQGIAETGSIAAAGRRMGMSYKRAWYLIETMNMYFREPVAVSSKGGAKGGGAVLTDTGKAVLTQYRHIQQKMEGAVQEDLKKLAALAKTAGGD